MEIAKGEDLQWSALKEPTRRNGESKKCRVESKKCFNSVALAISSNSVTMAMVTELYSSKYTECICVCMCVYVCVCVTVSA